MKNTLIAFTVGAIICGMCAAIYVNRVSIIASLAGKRTDSQLQAIDDNIKLAVSNTRRTETETRESVVIYRDRTIQEVKALPADDVVRGLNYELHLFRSGGLAESTAGVGGK